MVGTSSDSIHVIHVDDEPEFAELAADFVERQNPRVDVETATDPSDGLDRIRANGAHCVVSDYDMPDRNGIEFLEAVRAEYPDLPFILYTGKGSEEVASEAISSGVTDYLQKESGTSQYEILSNRIANAVEQYRAQEVAKETKQRLETIAENTNDILWKFTADWNELLFINSAYEEIWGRSLEELRSQPRSFLEGVHPDDRAHLREAMEELSTGSSVDIEFRVNADEDYGRWVWVKGEPVFNETGEVEKVVGFARNITDRKAREQALTDQRADLRLYKRAVDESTDLLAAADTEYKLLFANQQFRQYHGLSPEDIGRTELPDFLGDVWETEVKPRLDRTLAGESLRYEMERERPDGDNRMLDIRYYPLRDDEDTIIGAVAAMRDITDRVGRSESFQRQNEQRQRSREEIEPDSEVQHNRHPDEYEQFVDFFENSAVPMHWVGSDGFVLHANQAELDALGYSRDEYVGHHIAEFHADQEVIDDILERLSSDEELNDYEARMQRRDGTIRHVLIDSCVNWEDGEFVNTRCVTRDITERKKRERELQRKNDRLEEFASMVSHDLRSPLRVAEGQLQLASEERDWESLDAVAQAHDRMDTLIEDVLSLANAGKDLGETESVALASLVENSWRNVATDSATLELDVEKTIVADRSRLQQLLENVVRNAIDHGGSAVTVSVVGLPSGFYVEDDGPGITEAERAKVFDPGYSTAEDGTGYGLSIVRDIAEAHEWQVNVTDGSEGGLRVELKGVEGE